METGKVHLHVALPGNTAGVLIRLLQVREQRRHFFGGAQVVGVVFHAQAFIVLDVGVGLDTDQEVLYGCVLLGHVMAVVGEHQGDVQLFGHGDQGGVQQFQLRDVLVLLDLQVVSLKGLLIPPGALPGLVHPPFNYQARHLTGGATGERNNSLTVPLHNLLVYAGLVVEPLQVRVGDQLNEVTVPGVVLGQEGQVVGAFLIGVARLALAAGHVHLAPDDGFDPCVTALSVELHRAVQRAVVGDGQAVHTQFLGPLHQGWNPAQAVQ